MQEIEHPTQESNIENPHNGSHEKNLESNQSGLQKGKKKIKTEKECKDNKNEAVEGGREIKGRDFLICLTVEE